MEFSISLMIATLITNVAFIAAMLIAQWVEIRPKYFHWRIPDTCQRFLYWQDFRCQLLGDTIGLFFLQVVFFHLVANGLMSYASWGIFAIIAIADGCGFTLICLASKHKPDWGYPEVGRISIGGAIHSVYHGLNVAAIIMIGYQICKGNLPNWCIAIAVDGLVFYLLTVLWDFLEGNFKPLKLESNEIKTHGCCQNGFTM